MNLYFDKKKGLANAIQAVAYSVGAMFMAPLINWLFQEFNLQGSFLILSGLMMQTIPAAALLRPLEHTKKHENLLHISRHGADENDEACQRLTNQEGSTTREAATESSGSNFILLKGETEGSTESSERKSNACSHDSLQGFTDHAETIEMRISKGPCEGSHVGNSPQQSRESYPCNQHSSQPLLLHPKEQTILLQNSTRASAKTDPEIKTATSLGDINSTGCDTTKSSVGKNHTRNVNSRPVSHGNRLLRYLNGTIHLFLGEVMLDGRIRLFCVLMCAFNFNHMASAVFISGLAIERGYTVDHCALTMAVTAGLEIPIRLSSGFCFDLKSVRLRRPVFFGLCACVAAALGATLPMYPGKFSVLILWAVQQCIAGR